MCTMAGSTTQEPLKSQQKCIAIFALLCCFAVLVALMFSAVDLWGDEEDGITEDNCGRNCRIVLVENNPDDRPRPEDGRIHFPLSLGFHTLLDQAKHSVEIASPVWDLNSWGLERYANHAKQGQVLFQRLLSLKSHGVKLRIASSLNVSAELKTLADHEAEVRFVNMTALTRGELHSSFWIVDRKHIYIGSADMDWRSLSKRKELGVIVFNCSCLALDLHRVFSFYWQLQNRDYIPSIWSKRVTALYGRHDVLNLQLNTTWASAYVSVRNGFVTSQCMVSHSMQCMVTLTIRFIGNMGNIHHSIGHIGTMLRKAVGNSNIINCLTMIYGVGDMPSFFYFSLSFASYREAADRTRDIDAIQHIIQSAKTFIYICVTDYLPLVNRSLTGTSVTRYWSAIDEVIREAVVLRGVQVRLLISYWKKTHPLTFNFLTSLKTLCMQLDDCSLEVKIFSLKEQDEIQHILNHKYMVTDNAVYIGNHNWVGSEFAFNAGVGLVMTQSIQDRVVPILDHVKATFEREWKSRYSKSLQSSKDKEVKYRGLQLAGLKHHLPTE